MYYSQHTAIYIIRICGLYDKEKGTGHTIDILISTSVMPRMY